MVTVCILWRKVCINALSWKMMLLIKERGC